eukprot:scaffold616_cov257-Pinguiococcus_pyrenoidosus.AAC.27
MVRGMGLLFELFFSSTLAIRDESIPGALYVASRRSLALHTFPSCPAISFDIPPARLPTHWQLSYSEASATNRAAVQDVHDTIHSGKATGASETPQLLRDLLGGPLFSRFD